MSSGGILRIVKLIKKKELGLFDCQELSVAFMDAKNGFLTKFYIEMMIQKKKTTFIFSSKKSILKMNMVIEFIL